MYILRWALLVISLFVLAACGDVVMDRPSDGHNAYTSTYFIQTIDDGVIEKVGQQLTINKEQNILSVRNNNVIVFSIEMDKVVSIVATRKVM